MIKYDYLDRKGINMDDRWYSVSETAEYLGIKKDTLYKWITRKDIPAHKVGKLWKFKLKEIDDWIKKGKAGK